MGAALGLLTSIGLAIVAALFEWVQVLAPLYGVFVFAGLLIGFGSATINSGVIQCCWWWPVSKQGFVAGLFLCMATLGSAVFGAFAAPMIDGVGISSLMLLWSLTILAGSVLLLLFAADPPYVQVARAHRRAGGTIEPLPVKMPDALARCSLYRTLTRRCLLTQSELEKEKAAVMLSQAALRGKASAFGQEVFPTQSFVNDLGRSLVSGHSWCMITMASITLGCYLGLLVWVVTFFVQVFQTPPQQAGFILFGYGISSSMARIPSGMLVDRINPLLFMSITLLCACAGFVCLVASTLFELSVAACVIIAISTAGANTCCYKLVVSQCPDSISGTIGWMETLGSLLGFVLPLAFGALGSIPAVGQALGLRIGMIIPCALILLAFIPLFLTYRFRPSKEQHESPSDGRKL